MAKGSTSKKETATRKPGEASAAAAKLNIHQRVLAAIEAMTKLGPLERDKMDETQKYRFTSHTEIKKALTPILTHLGILHVMIPTAIEYGSRIQPGSNYVGHETPDKEVFFVRMEVTMQLINTDNPADMVVVKQWPGYGEDHGDKASSKAATIAEKTFLVKQFKILTADDEGDTGVDQTRGRRTVRPGVPTVPATRVQPVPPAQPAPAAQVAAASVVATKPPSPTTPTATTSASAPSATPPPPPVRSAAPAPALTTPVTPAPETPGTPETSPVADSAPAEPAKPALSKEGLLALAISGKLPVSAINVKIHNSGLEEAAKWVAQNHRRNCPTCADTKRISLMIAAHQGSQAAVIDNEVAGSDLPPLAG